MFTLHWTDVWNEVYSLISVLAYQSGPNFNQRRLIESKTSYWPFISCVSVTWVSPRPRPFKRLEAVLSPFILTGEMNVVTDYDQFFRPIITTDWTHFSQDTYLSNILTQKCHFSDTQIRRKLTLFETSLCLNNTLSRDLGTGASSLASQRT